ncbi:MAG: AbrB/MazE/SpoVT family DNA-binding protein [Patescibacteria group bacterium]|nr:AbrB family transcriptional regulator [Candidatus Saccharibacteria bacterium]MDQ5963372.1 AbrB/MazE/SpoVT family DNA-binding protein [Patescibacteria group bacterium]
MAFTTTQKLIKIGSSRGVILPARELKQLEISGDDELEIIVRKKSGASSNEEVLAAAEGIMHKYREAFQNLADR